ncbi:hypothetical protein WMF18_16360 [Sorangium sp. So ce315]|uniref:hypothetical protein n=1 Tax=Sorangium sp. So ce315 TaxID=3133299 RepID=UPI003F645797
MEQSPKLAAFVLAVAALSTSACAASLDPEAPADEAEDSASQAVQAHNALTSNALTSNALTADVMTASALTASALTAEALSSNALTAAALRDPDARTLLKYIASCALPADKSLTVSVDGVRLAFPGELGLAARWGQQGGACDGACRSWVSGCVLARLNYLGQKVSISVRGDRKELQADKAERAAFPRREATYFGDIFAERPVYQACLPPGASAIPRVCGPSLEACAVEIAGPCDALCDEPTDDGSFPNCRGTVRRPSGKIAVGKAPHAGSVTVFLR